MFDFAAILRDGTELRAMPPFTVDERPTDIFLTYNKEKNRLDRMAGQVYSDPTYWRVILWANPEYFIEFDIPDDTQIRIPYPLDEVQYELLDKIKAGRDRDVV